MLILLKINVDKKINSKKFMNYRNIVGIDIDWFVYGFFFLEKVIYYSMYSLYVKIIA